MGSRPGRVFQQPARVRTGLEPRKKPWTEPGKKKPFSPFEKQVTAELSTICNGWLFPIADSLFETARQSGPAAMEKFPVPPSH
jgi:hypothetical protein